MYTKNPVSGKNETLVNTSMLKGAVDGVVAKIAGKADQGALDALSVYAEHVADSVADKADKSAVAAVSDYVEGMLPKGVYTPLVEAYVGLACKVADPDILEGAAKMAYAADPVKYATSNPSRTDVAEVTYSNYKTGNPIYDAVTAAGSTVELPPFLRLKRWSESFGVPKTITSWKTELPNLTDGSNMFSATGLTSWKTELPNLTDGTGMFDSTPLTSWTVELPNLTNGESMFFNTNIEVWSTELPNLTTGRDMFGQNSLSEIGLKQFRGTLPSLIDGEGMFSRCKLDIDSLRCIAETINDVSQVETPTTKQLDIDIADDTYLEPNYDLYVNTIKEKGWNLTVNDATV